MPFPYNTVPDLCLQATVASMLTLWFSGFAYISLLFSKAASVSCTLNMQRLLLAWLCYIFCELVLSEEWKSRLLERKLKKLLKCIKPHFMLLSCCLISKITLILLLNWHNYLGNFIPFYDPVLCLQKEGKLLLLRLPALDGSMVLVRIPG